MKAYLVAFLLISFSSRVYAQFPTEPVSIPSPNVASQKMYGDVPVSYFTGVPSIEVPLYTIKSGPITVPLSLNYHASGFRPDNHPGWVGMGWNLNSGGMITRTVKDNQDEQNLFTYPNTGFYFSKNLLNTDSWNSYSYIESIAQGKSSFNDTEPDEFSFSFLNYQGKFYLNHKGEWQVKCDKPIKVSLHKTNPFLLVPFEPVNSAPWTNAFRDHGSSFGGFEITGEDGTKYIFGGTTTSIEYGIGIFRQNIEPWIADSWHLTSIVHPSGSKVTYLYEKEEFFINEMYISISENLGTKTSTPNYEKDGTSLMNPNCSSTSETNIDRHYSGRLIQPSYLTSIQYNNNTIEFDRSMSVELEYPLYAYDYYFKNNNTLAPPALPYLAQEGFSLDINLRKIKWHKLDNIYIKSNGKEIKSFIFKYNDITHRDLSIESDKSNERLTLLSLTEKGSDGTNKSPYEFFYHNYQGLPSYLLNQTDHWGFYTARVHATGLTNFINYEDYYSYRESNSDPSIYLRGTLKQIKYPTGGSTYFKFDQNKYSKYITNSRASIDNDNTGSNTAAGGLRIRQISNVIDNKIVSDRKFYYISNYTKNSDTTSSLSSGVLAGKARYYFKDYQLRSFNNTQVYTVLNTFSSHSLLTPSGSAGSHIGYSEVVEKRLDGSYTKYYYTNFENGHADEIPGPTENLQISHSLYEPFSSKDEERGKLLKLQIYNSADKLVKQKTISYIALNKSTEYVRSLKARYFNVCTGTAVSVAEGIAYKFYTYSYLPEVVEETIYDTKGLNGVTNKITYSYNNKRLPSKEVTTNSKGQSLVTEYKYSFDFTYPTTTPANDVIKGIKALPENNIIGNPLEITKSLAGKIIEANLLTYKFFDNLLLPYQNYSLKLNVPGSYTSANFNQATAAPVLDSNLDLKLTFVSYDNLGNPLNTLKEGNIKNRFLWGYNNTLPLAQINNVNSSQTVACTSFELDSPGNWSYDPDIGTSNHLKNDAQKSHSGQWYYSLSGTWSLNIANISTGEYELSFWASSTPTIFLGSAILSPLDTYIGTVNTQGYKFHRYKISCSANKNNLTIDAYGGATIQIDDVRLYPTSAQMISYTHDPLVGTTSISDADNQPTYYSYDGFQRIRIITDKDGNIQKKFEYTEKKL